MCDTAAARVGRCSEYWRSLRVVKGIEERGERAGSVAECRVRRDVIDPFPVDPYFAAIAQTLQKFVPCLRGASMLWL
ncbi:hypothetical protein GCM10022381_25730 [Leifsonia kafniensis]|uniref:Uncharacterized protein n=1 Tax=Leifsonia kafniensis TaxID=475957 RepID=A0ABP7KN21_9MICO